MLSDEERKLYEIIIQELEGIRMEFNSLNKRLDKKDREYKIENYIVNHEEELYNKIMELYPELFTSNTEFEDIEDYAREYIEDNYDILIGEDEDV